MFAIRFGLKVLFPGERERVSQHFFQKKKKTRRRQWSLAPKVIRGDENAVAACRGSIRAASRLLFSTCERETGSWIRFSVSNWQLRDYVIYPLSVHHPLLTPALTRVRPSSDQPADGRKPRFPETQPSLPLLFQPPSRALPSSSRHSFRHRPFAFPLCAQTIAFLLLPHDHPPAADARRRC